MSKNKDAKRKAKQKAKLAQAAQQEQARIEHIANAVMEICSPLEPDYIDDSQTTDIKGRLILWRLGMIAWNLALVGHKDIPLGDLDKMSLDEEHREIVAKAVARLIRRKYELYPNIRFSIENIACPIIAGKPRLKVSIGQQYHDFGIPSYDDEPKPIAPDDIRAIRKSLGLSQVMFAMALGVSVKKVSAWEHGKVVPNDEDVKRIVAIEKDEHFLCMKNLLYKKTRKEGRNPQKKWCREPIQQLISSPIYKPTENNGMKDVSSQRRNIISRVNCVLKGQTFQIGRFVFRGQKKSILSAILNKDGEPNDECTMYNHLFYFGEKARWYYSPDGITNYQNTNEVEIVTGDKLFDFISRELSKDKNKTKTSEKSNLFQFFNDEKNRDRFKDVIKDNPLFCRYYNFFLHTLGYKSGKPSPFLSTSLRYSIAKKFALNQYKTKESGPIILVGTLPDEMINGEFAMNAFYSIIDAPKDIESELTKCNLPVLTKEWVYKYQKEIVLACGMLPHNIWGIFDLEEKKVVVNPHMLEPENKDQRRLFFDFDQKDFENNLPKTNYWNGFCIESCKLCPILFS